MDAEAQHYTILTYDIQLSTKLDNATKHMLRQRLQDACVIASAAAKVPDDAITVLDRGDGAILLLRADVPKERVLGAWLGALHGRLQDAYMRSTPRVQVRLAVHAGEVRPSGDGQVSRDIDFACRLVDAPEAKRILAAVPSAALAVVVSEAVYDQVVRPSGALLEPSAYVRIPVRVKETDTTARLRLPGWATVPVPEPETPETPGKRSAPNADAPGTGGVFHGPVGVVGQATDNTFNFGGGER